MTVSGTEIVLRLEKVTRRYGEVEAVHCLDLAVLRGEFLAVVGPSGSGKTTLLNLLAGHDQPTEGRVERRGELRAIYQQGGLFPWLTVRENILMGLRAVRDGAQQEKMLAELLALIGLKSFAEHYPHQLSGGMQQRVELARALAGRTDILLMDEPFSALDYLTRMRMRQELTRLLHERPCTVVFVTHDVEEAVQLADRILVLTERPARVRCELRLDDLPRPRSLAQPGMIGAVERLLHLLGVEE